MGEPDHHRMHNYAFHPRVVNWVESTSLAQFDGPSDDVPEPDPDAFYRSSVSYPGDTQLISLETDMTTTRQRQQTSNGAARSVPKPSMRSVSGPATSTLPSTRQTAQLSGNRPTVRDLAQKFNQTPSAESSPNSRVRLMKASPSPRAVASSPNPHQASSTSSPSRLTKEASYGPHKFSNLKPRERPQPAPASPASVRRVHGSRPSLDGQTTPSRRKLSSPTRSHAQPASSVRQPFFGEVVGEHDAVTPGYGIPSFEAPPQESASGISPTADSPAMKLVPGYFHSSSQPQNSPNVSVHHHARSASNTTDMSTGGTQPTQPLQPNRRPSPPSRIPVATRRRSLTSDSGSSTKSSKNGSSRAGGTYNKRSPVRTHRKPVGSENTIPYKSNGSVQPTYLPAASYRGYQSHTKAAKAVANGKSLTAVINAPPPPTSPRLRNSRERQLLPQDDGKPKVVHAGEHASANYFEETEGLKEQEEPDVSRLENTNEPFPLDTKPGQTVEVLVTGDLSEPLSATTMDSELSRLEQDAAFSIAHKEPLTIHTTSLPIPQQSEPPSSTTDFEYEESPVLGMPGSFMMTPPLAQDTPRVQAEEEHGKDESPQNVRENDNEKETEMGNSNANVDASMKMDMEGELLQARTFQPPQLATNKGLPGTAEAPHDTPHNAPSEFAVSESIPIMLGADEPQGGMPRSRPSPRVTIGAHKWRAEPLDASGTISYLEEEEDSPIDPFSRRETLHPDDSASVAFYRRADGRSSDWAPPVPPLPTSGRLTMDSEAYSVINKVLNMYHGSAIVTPQLAYESQQQVQSVSPIIAQHRDWGSKEATETYLARLLSDANISEDRSASNGVSNERLDSSSSHRVPSLSLPGVDEDPAEDEHVGTAIIFPPESRRYSRGSRGSNTTSWEDGSRADSSSASISRDYVTGALAATARPQPSTYAPHPPPKDWHYSGHGSPSYTVGETPRASSERSGASFGSLLPEIESAGEGLGLSLLAGQQQTQAPPPRPAYSPPPPPIPPSIDRATAPYTPSVYHIQPPSSVVPQAPFPGLKDEMCYKGKAHDRFLDDGDEIPLLPRIAYREMANTAPEQPPRAPPAASNGQPAKLSSDERHAEESSHSTEGAETVNGAGPADESQSANDGQPTDGALPGSGAQSGDNGVLDTSILSDPADGGVTGESSASAVDPALMKRYNIIYELIKTEKIYTDDLRVVVVLFIESARSMDIITDEEQRILFSNISEICIFSANFWDELRRSIKPILQTKPRPPKQSDKPAQAPKDTDDDRASSVATQSYDWDEYEHLNEENYQQITIGACIQAHLKRIETLYTTYILNHDRANSLLTTKIEAKDWKLLGWQMACMQNSTGLTDAWDLNSLLVKPTQRLMKYPLLLGELGKVTPPDHPDFAALEAARKELIEISFRINEAKKRQDNLRAASQELAKKEQEKGKRPLEVRLGKNILNAITGKSQKAKPPIEEAAIFNDEDYTYQAQRFGGHFFQIQVVLRDVENYLEEIHNWMLHLNCMALNFVTVLDSAPTQYTEMASSWHRSAMSLLELQNVALEDHKQVIRVRVLKPLMEVWKLHSRPQKLMEQRKKGLQQYAKFKQALNKKEKIDPKLQDAADQFKIINDTLKLELPKLYDLTKKLVLQCEKSFIGYQRDWWKNCQKKMLPLLEVEPEYTTSLPYDLKAYRDRFYTDFMVPQGRVARLGICNRSLLMEMANFMSPIPGPVRSPEETSSRKSTQSKPSSRRTESISSDMSNHEDVRDARSRRSGGYAEQRANIPSTSSSMDTSGYSWKNIPMSQEYRRIAGPAPPITSNLQPSPTIGGPSAANRAMSPESDSDSSDVTVTQGNSGRNRMMGLDGVFDDSYMPPEMMDSAFLGPSHQSSTSISSRTSGIFNSALPMSDSPVQAEPSASSTDEPEVLFLAASLFEFNIAHDRREGGIPYLVYVPGEIFDVIGMKGELWLARNQDDESRTVGWIWEKHFARILPDES
ncbi:hypothetical protein CC78DRAFT_537309 [Lojkania enalia]|uniref:DH domain-containing protein n=1 Tax=Lojkania enalia TaxID=147567 RepID=A0A9P4N5A3_9PLEO|nr:hypothetical protein CC78DRAFT_537309 [Didymosphaeria enalia]